MFLEVATTHRPATDLGFLVHKNPSRLHAVELPVGTAHLFYPEAGEDRCSLVLSLEVDSSETVRAKGDAGLIDHYVNDRAYVASTSFCVAMARTLSEAMRGRSRERQELAGSAIPLAARVGPVAARDPAMVRRLFEPLGYSVAEERGDAVPGRSAYGPSSHAVLSLRATTRLSDLLTHLYVLLPVLDGRRKHYFVGEDEVDKLLDRGGEWLASHPERDYIVGRFLSRHGDLVRAASARLSEVDGDVEPSEGDVAVPAEKAAEAAMRLHDRRLDRVASILVAAGARRVLDLGCGSGKLLERLAAEPSVSKVLGVEVGVRDLARAGERIGRLPERLGGKVETVQGSLLYRDRRLSGYDAAALVEVIEHVEPSRLRHLERSVFGHARPGIVVVTTPNREWNVLYGLPEGELRHPDHRFEFDRASFRAWAEGIAGTYGYAVEFDGVGDVDADLGQPTQTATFRLATPELSP